jgi:uncharacterized membrane protein YcaP (DUF421 family)
MVLASIATDLFTMGVPVAEKALRTFAVYAGVLLLLRVAGKRDLAQLNSLDLTVLLLLSNVVQNAIIGNDNSLAGGLLGALLLVLFNAVMVRIAWSSETAVRLFEGEPTEIVHDGQLVHAAVRRLALRVADVENAVRRQGATSLREVASATIEPGGSIVVQLRDESVPATRDDIARLEAKLDALLASS